LILAFLVSTLLSVSQIDSTDEGAHTHTVGLSNSPGLTCRTIDVALVYEQPSMSAKVLGRTQSFIAVTGREVNGFIPMVTGKRVKGWVRAKETIAGKPGDALGPCIVQMQSDGRLLFSWP
jgi:hypothetical protein